MLQKLWKTFCSLVGLIIALAIAAFGAAMTTNYNNAKANLISYIPDNIPQWAGPALICLGFIIFIWWLVWILTPAKNKNDAFPDSPNSKKNNVTPPNMAVAQKENENVENSKSDGEAEMIVGKESVVYGNVPANAEIGDGSVVIGPTDKNGNTILNPSGSTAIGAGARAGQNALAVGAGAVAGLGSVSIGARAGGTQVIHTPENSPNNVPNSEK